MITVFGRNYYGNSYTCIPNGWAAKFDGINDYAVLGGTGVVPYNTPTKALYSMWLKVDDLTSPNSSYFFYSQQANGNTFDFWRIFYAPKNSSGSPLNRLGVEWRANGSSNNIQKQYALHGNSAITGSTSSTSYWNASNSNINTNPNGYVHLTVIFDLPAIGSAMSTGGVEVFWNGQLLTNTVVNQANGTSQTSIPTNSLSRYLAVNGSNNTGFFNGKIDELFMLNGSSLTTWMNSTGLTTNQNIASYLYNGNCPVAIVQDGRWEFGWTRFENNWDVGGTNPTGTYTSWNPINGATFSTDVA